MTSQESTTRGTAKVEVFPVDEQQVASIATAALRGGIPRLYANGFIIAQSASDLAVVMLANGTPSSLVSMSFISAKTLSIELTKAISNLEKAIGDTIPTIEEVQEKLSKAQG
jgi:hypothetical protein